jgi:hypothetical protein
MIEATARAATGAKEVEIRADGSAELALQP